MYIEHINRFERIYSILLKIENSYIPALSNQVDSIESYAKKLSENAETFILSEKKDDIGILSIYCNDVDTKIAFISTFGFYKKCKGKGFAKELLIYCLNYIKTIDFNIIDLEVNKVNERAIKFYKNNGFNIIENKISSYVMRLILN